MMKRNLLAITVVSLLGLSSPPSMAHDYVSNARPALIIRGAGPLVAPAPVVASVPAPAPAPAPVHIVKATAAKPAPEPAPKPVAIPAGPLKRRTRL